MRISIGTKKIACMHGGITKGLNEKFDQLVEHESATCQLSDEERLAILWSDAMKEKWDQSRDNYIEGIRGLAAAKQFSSKAVQEEKFDYIIRGHQHQYVKICII